MNNAQRKYKTKIIRKYIEIYPNESDLIEFIDELKKSGIPFNSYVKTLIKIIIEMSKVGE